MAFMNNEDVQENFDNIIDKLDYISATGDHMETFIDTIRDSLASISGQLQEIIGLMSGGDK